MIMIMNIISARCEGADRLRILNQKRQKWLKDVAGKSLSFLAGTNLESSVWPVLIAIKLTVWGDVVSLVGMVLH